MADAILVARGLIRRFGGVRAVDGVDLSVASGELRAIIGPNGAGKTTLFNLLTGNISAQSGRVEFDGADVTGLQPHRLCRRGIGRTFQINNIFVNATVRENVRLARLAHRGLAWNMVRQTRHLLRSETEELVAMVGLGDLLDVPGYALSYGDRRRLELAIALACEPRLLLLDEPTCGMSIAERAPLIDLIRDLMRQRGMTAILIEHDMDIVFSAAHRISVMHHGRFIAHGTPAEIERDPEVRRIYLGEECAA